MSEVLSREDIERIATYLDDAGHPYSYEQLLDHDAEQRKQIAALQRRVEELEGLSSQVYQVVGSLSSDAGMFDHPATTKVLDNLSMAASGKPLPHAELLPFPAKAPHEARG